MRSAAVDNVTREMVLISGILGTGRRRRPRCSGDTGKVLPTSGSPWLWRRLGEEGQDRRMAVEISGATLCPSDDLITGARLDRPRTGLVSGPVLEHDWNGRPRTGLHRCGAGCLPGWRHAAANLGLYPRPCSQSWLPVPAGNVIGAM